MKPSTIDIPGAPQKVTAQLFEPSAKAAAGLVVLAYGTDGYIDNERGPWQTMMKGYAEELAMRGMFALIPDYFARTGSLHGGPAAHEIIDKRHDWAAALIDTASHARTLSGVDPARIGVLGFSLGGYLCLLTRAAVAPAALVAYFPPIFDGLGPPGTVAYAQVHHGTNDRPPTAVGNAAVVEATLRGEKTEVQKFEYAGATHGFASASPADLKAAADSKATTLEFFAKRL